MKLPSLSVIIISQAILWCVAGAYIISWKILLYPAVWLLVGAGFYFHNKAFPVIQNSAEPELSRGPFANSQTAADAGPTDKKVAAGS